MGQPLNIYEPIDWTFQKVVNTAFATVLVVAMPMVVASLVYKS